MAYSVTSRIPFEPWKRYISGVSQPRFNRRYTGIFPYSKSVGCTSGMLRPSGQRRMPPMEVVRPGGSFQPSMKFMPLTRCTSKAPATPVPYWLQQRHRAKILGSNATFGTLFCHVSQSKVCGERSGGGGYSQHPVGSLRPSEPSTRFRSPMMPCDRSSLDLAQITELTRCEPTWMMRPVFFCAFTISIPSDGACDMGFSIYTSLPAFT